MSEQMFEKASRLKLRIETNKGNVTVEDLWELPLTTTRNNLNLDDIAKGLHKQIKETSEVSFVETPSKANELLQLKFDLVLHIINVKKKENEEKLAKAQKAETKEKLKAILAKKEEASLENLSEEEIRKQLAEL